MIEALSRLIKRLGYVFSRGTQRRGQSILLLIPLSCRQLANNALLPSSRDSSSDHGNRGVGGEGKLGLPGSGKAPGLGNASGSRSGCASAGASCIGTDLRLRFA